MAVVTATLADLGADVTELYGLDCIGRLAGVLSTATDDPPVDLVVCGVDGDSARGDDAISVPAAPDALRGHLARGGGLVVLRESLRWLEDHPQWQEVVGALWDPDVAGTAPHGRYRVEIVAPTHPVVDDVPTFEAVAAPPVFVDVRPDVTVLAAVRWAGREHPVWWAHTLDGGRVVHDALGADRTAEVPPQRQEMLAQAVRWCARVGPLTDDADPHYELELRDEDVAAWTRPVSRDPSRPPA
jgi:hypothetical protein